MLYIGPCCLSILYTIVSFLVSILFKALGSGPTSAPPAPHGAPAKLHAVSQTFCVSQATVGHY